MAQFNFKAIGTSWQIDIYQEITPAREAEVFSRIQERVEKFDHDYSRFRADSIVTQISKNPGTYVLPDDAPPIMNLYHELYKRTGGLMTLLIGNLISDAGYDAQYSLKPKEKLSAPLDWDEVIEYSHPNLIVKKPVMLDFGAAGKGYLIDIVGGVLESCGVTEYCIDAGGDILHKGSAAIRIGLEHPEHFDQVVGVANLQNGSLCGSAGNRRVWDKFTHIINPKTQTSPRNILAVWVSAKTALLADAIATCLFFVSASDLSGEYQFEYALIRDDYSIEKSAHFPGDLFTE